MNVSEDINMSFIDDLFNNQVRLKKAKKKLHRWHLIFDD